MGLVMKKWQELSLNALMNFSVAIMAGGALKILLDSQSVVAAVMSFIFGAYMLFSVVLLAKNTEERGKKW